MRSARVNQAAWLGEMPSQDAGAEPIIQVLTDLPAGEPNAFYMDLHDRDGLPVDDLDLRLGDAIAFDVQDGIHKAVRWAGREFRQRGYSFDQHAENAA